MGDMTPHFSRSEFACKGTQCCGHAAPVDTALVNGLECLRFRLKIAYPDKFKSIYISSGFRCPVHNREVGSKETSQHPLATASDIKSSGLTSQEIADEAEHVPVFTSGGIGIYGWGVHVDSRTDGPARWDNRGEGD